MGAAGVTGVGGANALGPDGMLPGVGTVRPGSGTNPEEGVWYVVGAGTVAGGKVGGYPVGCVTGG